MHNNFFIIILLFLNQFKSVYSSFILLFINNFKSIALSFCIIHSHYKFNLSIYLKVVHSLIQRLLQVAIIKRNDLTILKFFTKFKMLIVKLHSFIFLNCVISSFDFTTFEDEQLQLKKNL